MSIVFNAHVKQRSWRGYDDPGLPVGMYFAQGAVTGDASGGNQIVIFNFRNEGSPASGRFYNIEQMSAFHTDNTTRIYALVATNWESVSEAGLINRQWMGQVEATTNAVASMSTRAQTPLPLFLGITSPVASLAAQVELHISNINLTSWVVTIQGYIWEPRSVLVQGGLRRPVDSLYGGGRQ